MLYVVTCDMEDFENSRALDMMAILFIGEREEVSEVTSAGEGVDVAMLT